MRRISAGMIVIAAITFATTATPLSITSPFCIAEDRTEYYHVNEIQNDLLTAVLFSGSLVEPDYTTVLLLSCATGRRVNVTNNGELTDTSWTDVLHEMDAIIDSDEIYSFEDVRNYFAISGYDAEIEDFNNNSCICNLEDSDQ